MTTTEHPRMRRPRVGRAVRRMATRTAAWVAAVSLVTAVASQPVLAQEEPVDVQTNDDAQGTVAISAFGNADGEVLAVNGMGGDASSDYVAASGLGGDATSEYFSVAGNGTSDGAIAISGVGDAYGWLAAAAGAGQGHAPVLVISGTQDSDATVAVSGIGDSSGSVAGSGIGGSTGLIAFSGFGGSEGTWAAVTGQGTSDSGILAVTGIGGADGLIAATGAGMSTGTIAISVVGRAYGLGAISGSGDISTIGADLSNPASGLVNDVLTDVVPGIVELPFPRCVDRLGEAFCEAFGFMGVSMDDPALPIRIIDRLAGTAIPVGTDTGDGVSGTFDLLPTNTARDTNWAIDKQQALKAVPQTWFDLPAGVEVSVDLGSEASITSIGWSHFWWWLTRFIFADDWTSSIQEEQVRSYWCGPATMTMVGRTGGYAVSQETWANSNHLATTTEGSALSEEIRLTNAKTDHGDRGGHRNYSERNVQDLTVGEFYFAHVARIGFMGGPVLEHVLLERKYFGPSHHFKYDHGGHLSFGGGYRTSDNNGTQILIYEVYDERDHTDSTVYTAGRRWVDIDLLHGATVAHPHKNFGF